MWPRSNRCRSTAWRDGNVSNLLSNSGSRLGLVDGLWTTTNTVAGEALWQAGDDFAQGRYRASRAADHYDVAAGHAHHYARPSAPVNLAGPGLAGPGRQRPCLALSTGANANEDELSAWRRSRGGRIRSRPLR